MKALCWSIICSFMISAGASGAVDSTGIRLYRSGSLKKAQSWFESAVKKNPRDAESYYYLAMSLLRQEKSDEAEDAIDEALEIDENVSKYHYARGAILGERAMKANVLKQGLLAPKIKNAFLRSVELDQNNIDGHIGLFNYYMQAPGFMGGSEEKGMEEAKIITELNPYRGHSTLAGYYARKKEMASAEAEYRKMAQSEPKNPEGWYRLGIFLFNQKKQDEAQAQFRKILEIDPKSAETNYFYGRALYTMDEWDKAMEKFQYVLFVEKNDPGAIWMLANCYEKKGMTARAKETYQWLLQVEPEGRRSDMAKEKVRTLR
ncbi:MAG: tetratricopeptide repeat protein [Acidobacteriota bacterium]